MMLVQKEKTKKRDFGDTVPPKTAFNMLAGLTGSIVQSVEIMVVQTPAGFSDLYVVPKTFDAKSKSTARFELSDILLVRDCLILMNGQTPPGRNTVVFTNPLDTLFQVVVNQPFDDARFAATLAMIGPFLAENGYWVEKYAGGARIVRLQERSVGEGDAA